MKLELDLIPMPLFGLSIAQTQRTAWKKLRYWALESEGCCEICDSETDKLEVHEKWTYTVNGITGIQRLSDLFVLCADCHRFKHYGRSEIVLTPRQLAELKQHAMRVNGCSVQDLNRHIKSAEYRWRQLNKLVWTQDFSPWLPYQCYRCDAKRGLEYRGFWICARCAEKEDYEYLMGDDNWTSEYSEEYIGPAAMRD